MQRVVVVVVTQRVLATKLCKSFGYDIGTFHYMVFSSTLIVGMCWI